MLHPPIAGTGTGRPPNRLRTHSRHAGFPKIVDLGPKALINLERVKRIEPSTRSLGSGVMSGLIPSSDDAEIAAKQGRVGMRRGGVLVSPRLPADLGT
jgi:hypothetical protein